jgi:phospholipase D1/2
VTLADNQPLMPWQDIHVKIEGKAVSDLVLNFVLRWNHAEKMGSKIEYKDFHGDKEISYKHVYHSLPLPTPEEYSTIDDVGNTSIQVLRSAPLFLRQRELNRAITLSRSARKQSHVLNNLHPPQTCQSDIYQVMLKLIKRAKRFIYLENQFFISDYGKPSIPSSNNVLSEVAKTQGGLSPRLTKLLSNTAKELPQNQIVKALSDKVANTIFAYQPEPFHIYITLPVHPEGLLNNGSIMATVHQTMQTISFGSDSLLNRIRKHLWVYQQLIKDEVPRNEWGKCRPAYYDKIGDKYKTIPLEECDKCVTLLNLRSWAELDNRTVTEQIYVHSKLTIVDDLYVLVGSANINDRSLLGGRDSGLAALIVDNDTQTLTCPERCIDIPVRQFAYQSRKKNWQGLFGDELANAIDMPELASSVTAIQSRARANTEIFESVFPFIPRNYLNKNYSEDIEKPKFASIWPALDKDKLEEDIQTKWEKTKVILDKVKTHSVFAQQYPRYIDE